VTIYRWVQRFTPLLIDVACCRHPSDRCFVDETYVKVAGRWVYLYRAINQYGQVIDALLPTCCLYPPSARSQSRPTSEVSVVPVIAV
jgi:hypothetical protein